MKFLALVDSVEGSYSGGITEERKRAVDVLSMNLKDVVDCVGACKVCILTSNHISAKESANIIRRYFPGCYFEECGDLRSDKYHESSHFRATDFIAKNAFFDVVIVVTHSEYVRILPYAYARATYERYRQEDVSFPVVAEGEAIVVAFRTSCSSTVVTSSRGKDCCGEAEAIDDDIPF